MSSASKSKAADDNGVSSSEQPEQQAAARFVVQGIRRTERSRGAFTNETKVRLVDCSYMSCLQALFFSHQVLLLLHRLYLRLLLRAFRTPLLLSLLLSLTRHPLRLSTRITRDLDRLAPSVMPPRHPPVERTMLLPL